MLISLQNQLHPSAWIILFLIIAIFVAAIIINMVLRKKYLSILDDLEDKVQKRRGVYSSEVLNKIVFDYKSAAMGSYNEVNTQAIIEKSINSELRIMNMGERFIKQSISLLIILGLLGTFLGLTISVGSLVEVLGNETEIMNNFDSIVQGLLSSVSGMAVAFITSLFGIGTSIILTILNIIINVEEARENLLVSIEEYLDNTVALIISKDKETEYTMMNKILKNTFEEFGTKIENTLKHTVETFGEKLTKVVMEVEVSSKVLDTTVEKFDNSLKNFAENIRDFSEFNFNLRNNIERMDVSFIKATEAIKSTSEIIKSNYDTLEEFSSSIKAAGDEITMYNKKVIEEIGNLVGQVNVSVLSIKELADSINKEMNERNQDILKHTENVKDLVNITGSELKLLGDITASSFKNTIENTGKQVYKDTISNVKDVSDELLKVIKEFEENQKVFAKTLAMLPEQVITYNENSVLKTEQKLDEIKQLIEK